MGSETEDLVDDGFSPEERAQFAEMEKATAGDSAGSDAAGAAGAEGAAGEGDAADAAAAAASKGDGAAGAANAAGDADAGAAAKAGAAGAGAGDAEAEAEADTGEDDDDDGDEPAAGAADGKVGADGQPARRKKGRVSAKKYQDAEARATAAEARAAAAELTTARFDERMRILNEALTTPKQKSGEAEDDDPKPDKEADAFAYMDWQERQLAKLAKRLDGVQQGTQHRDEAQTLASTYEGDARDYVAREPNFGFAYNHLMQTRVQQLALYHFGVDLTEPGAKLDPQQVANIQRDIAAEEQGIVAAALRAKKSPAEAIYKMAKATGYRPKTKEQIAEMMAGARGNGGAAPAAGAGANGANNGAGNGANGGKPAANGKAPAKVDVAAEIKRIKDGSEASVSLSNGGGSSPSPLTPQRIANMTDAEFAELADNISPEEWQMLVEGRP